jgi:hypothetical protein
MTCLEHFLNLFQDFHFSFISRCITAPCIIIYLCDYGAPPVVRHHALRVPHHPTIAVIDPRILRWRVLGRRGRGLPGLERWAWSCATNAPERRRRERADPDPYQRRPTCGLARRDQGEREVVPVEAPEGDVRVTDERGMEKGMA